GPSITSRADSRSSSRSTPSCGVSMRSAGRRSPPVRAVFRSIGHTCRMRVSLPYGDGTVHVEIPDRIETEVVVPPASDPAGDERAVVAAALDAPVGSPALETRARGCRRVVVVVPDRTRAARTAVWLPLVLKRLSAAGVPDAAVRVLVGGGIHAPADAA